VLGPFQVPGFDSLPLFNTTQYVAQRYNYSQPPGLRRILLRSPCFDTYSVSCRHTYLYYAIFQFTP
jgi:hypothetical protein